MTAGTFRVEWTEVARRDLEEMLAYLAARSPTSALQLLEKIEAQSASLDSLPNRGRVPPELAALQVQLYREIQIPPYRLLYRGYEDLVVVLAVFDGRRDLEDVILGRILRA